MRGLGKLVGVRRAVVFGEVYSVVGLGTPDASGHHLVYMGFLGMTSVQLFEC